MNMIIDQTMPFWYAEQECWVVKETPDWIVAVVPMIFNDRICIANKQEFGRTWTAGWCYDQTTEANIAKAYAAEWDPATAQRPLGFKKIAFDSRGMSYLDLDDWQYVCRWCQNDLRLRERHPDAQESDFPTICAQCGVTRDNGAWYQGYATTLRHPKGRPE